MAYKLAEENLRATKTTEAQLLVIEAAMAGPAPARACALADVLGQKPGLLDPARVILSRAYSACRQPDRATAILSPAAGPRASLQGPQPASLPPAT